MRAGAGAMALIGCALIGSTLWLAREARAEPRPGTYLALGDALAYGMQIAKLRARIAAGAVRPESFDTGYVDVLAAHLRTRTPDLTVVDLGCPGESTISFVAGPCGFATSGKPFGTPPLPLHTAYPGAQLAAASAYLDEHPGEVGLITLDIGINDLRTVLAACPEGEGRHACVAAALPAALERAGANLRTILCRLKAAAPGARILVATVYDWLAGADPEGDPAVLALNRTITTEASRAGAGLVDIHPAFNCTGDPRERLCALTLLCTPAQDLHPSDAGYRVIGDLFAAQAQIGGGRP